MTTTTQPTTASLKLCELAGIVRTASPERLPHVLTVLWTDHLRHFMHRSQWLVVRENAVRSEERAWFISKIAEVCETIASLPTTGETDGQGMAATVRLHYFHRGADMWLTEKDIGDTADEDAGQQTQAFGAVSLGYGPELGYADLSSFLADGAELDLHFTPISLAQLMKQHA